MADAGSNRSGAPNAAEPEATSNGKIMTALTSFMIEDLASVFDMAKDGPTGLALGLGSKALATGSLVAETTESRGGKLGAFVGKEVLQTLNLARLASETNPNVIIAKIGTAFILKTAAAFSLGGDDNRQAELLGACAEVVGQTLAMGVSVTEVVASEGFAIPLAVLNAAALAVAVHKAYAAITRSKPSR